MNSLGEMFVRILGDNTNFDKSIDASEKKLDSFGKKAKEIGGKLTTFVTLPLIGIGTAFVKVASDAEETNSKFDAVFKEQSKTVRDWASTFSQSVNRSTTANIGFLATIQDTLVPLGFARDAAADMSKQVVSLATDLGSFNNIPTAQVVNDIQSAIVGNTETLRKYGVVASQAAIETEALTSGIISNKNELDATSKAQAIYQLLIQGTTDAQGDAIRTSDSTANRLQGLKSSVEDLSIAFGEQLLPFVNDLIEGVTDLVNFFGDLDDETKNLILTFGAVAIAAAPVIATIGGIVSAATAAKAALATMNTAILGPIGLVVAGAALIGVLIKVGIETKKAKEEALLYADQIQALTNISKSGWESNLEALEKVNEKLLQLNTNTVSTTLNVDQLKGILANVTQGLNTSAEALEIVKREFGLTTIEAQNFIDTFGNFQGQGFTTSNGLTIYTTTLKAFNSELLETTEGSKSLSENFAKLAAEFKFARNEAQLTGDELTALGSIIRTDTESQLSNLLAQLRNIGQESEFNASALSFLEGRIKDLTTLGFEPTGDTLKDLIAQLNYYKQATESGADNTLIVTETQKTLLKSLNELDQMYAAFGDEVDVNIEKQNLYKAALQTLISSGIDPQTEAYQELLDMYDDLKDANDERIDQINDEIDAENFHINLIEERVRRQEAAINKESQLRENLAKQIEEEEEETKDNLKQVGDYALEIMSLTTQSTEEAIYSILKLTAQIAASTGTLEGQITALVAGLLAGIIETYERLRYKAEEYLISTKSIELEILNIKRDAARQALDEQLSAIDKAEQAELKRLGFIEKTEKETLQERLKEAIAANDKELQAELEKEIQKQTILDKYEAQRQAIQEAAQKEEKRAARERVQIEKEIALAQAEINKQKAISDLGIFASKNKKDAVTQLYDELIATINSIQLPALATGGIVQPRAGGVPAILAEAGQPEIIFPLDRLNEFIAGQPQQGGDVGDIKLTVNLDSKPFLEKIFPATRNRSILISAGAVV